MGMGRFNTIVLYGKILNFHFFIKTGLSFALSPCVSVDTEPCLSCFDELYIFLIVLSKLNK